MNRILFEEQQPVYTLDPGDPRFDHVRGVLRMQKGDSFDIGVINGPTGKALIVGLDKESLQVEASWGERPPLPPDIRLLVGMCRPATVRKLLSTIPTMGVRYLDFVSTGRTDSAYAKASIWKEGEWRRRFVEGVEQSFDTFLPEVEVADSLETYCRKLPERSNRLALDVYEGSRRLSTVSLQKGESITLAIGPERGWSATDRKILVENGFSLVSLNERVLRVETAVIVGLTLVLERLGNY